MQRLLPQKGRASYWAQSLARFIQSFSKRAGEHRKLQESVQKFLQMVPKRKIPAISAGVRQNVEQACLYLVQKQPPFPLRRRLITLA